MNNRHLVATATVGIALAAGCQPGPLPVGTVIQQSGTQTTETTAFRQVSGDSVKEQKGVVGAGESCSDAQQSTGTLHQVADSYLDQHIEVVGTMPTYHPLSPEGDFGKTTASVVEVVKVLENEVDYEETFFSPSADPQNWTESGEGITDLVTSAERYALAEGEYLVMFNDLSEVWTKDPNPGVHDGEGEEPSWGMLTRVNPSSGDTWPSQNGETLYQFVERERVSVGDQEVRADKISLTQIAQHDPREADLLDACIHELSQTHTDTSLEEDQTVTITEAHLDPGCIGNYTHLRLGYEWWHDNAMVKEETTTYQMTINDYGYEWYIEDGGVCFRDTATTKPLDSDISAVPFVEYTLSVVERSLTTDSWTRE